MILEFEKFSASCVCCFEQISKYYGSCNEITSSLSSNIYILQGEIDCGAWAFVSAFSKQCKEKQLLSNSKVLYNGKSLSKKEIENLAYYIDGKLNIYTKNCFFKASVERLLKKNRFPASFDDIIKLFRVPDYVLNRPLKYCGVYRSVYQAIVGLIKGNRVFTTRWYGEYGFDSSAIIPMIEALRAYDCILLIPSSKKNNFGENCVYIDINDWFSIPIQKKYRDD